MTEFVLEQNNKMFVLISDKEYYFQDYCKVVINYARFLNKPLELGMFVPCDEEGNVLEEPKRWKDYLEAPESFDGNKEWYELRIYEEAKERVLFEGVDCYKQYKGYCVHQTGEGHLLGAYTSGKINSRYKIVQDLVGRNLTLTESAKKQIGITN